MPFLFWFFLGLIVPLPLGIAGFVLHRRVARKEALQEQRIEDLRANILWYARTLPRSSRESSVPRSAHAEYRQLERLLLVARSIGVDDAAQDAIAERMDDVWLSVLDGQVDADGRNLHPDGCFVAPSPAVLSVLRDCASDGHHVCPECARCDLEARERSRY